MTIFDPLNVMEDSSLHSMPVDVVEINELVKMSEDVADAVDPNDDPRIAIAVAKSFMTQFSQETLVFSEIKRFSKIILRFSVEELTKHYDSS